PTFTQTATNLKTIKTINNMIFKDLLLSYDWNTVWNAIRLRYPKEFRNLKGYRYVYNRLIQLDPYPTDSKMRIIDVSDTPEEINPDAFMLEREEQTGEYTDYALTMLPWQQVISLELDPEND